MKRIRLTHDTVVRFPAGTVLDVSDEEASRLLAFNNASLLIEKETENAGKVETAEKKTKKVRKQ